MNSLILYSAIMAGFGLIDLATPGSGSPPFDFGIAMVLLGFGLAKVRADDGKV